MRRIVSSWFLILTVLTNTSLSQVIIREKVQIQPAPRLIKTSTASSVSYFSPPTFLTPAVGLPRVALPSNMTVGGTIDFAASQLEPRQWALLRLTGVGPTAIELHYIEKTINGELIERRNTFSGPVGVCGGGVPQLQTFDGSVGGSSIQFNNSGNQVTYTLTGGLRQGPSRFVVPVPATVTSSASAQPGFELAQWAIGPSQDSLVGNGSATLTITALNAGGDQYFVCTTSNADATVTVSIQAQGEYAFLRGPDGQEGSSITLSFLVDGGFSAIKTCSLILDESRGSLPGGRDVATITVSGGPTATKQVVLRRSLDHFFVEMGPPDIDFGSTSFVFVTAVNVYGNGVELADETMIRLTIDQPQYGTFIDLEGNERDTVDVSYFDAYVGNVQFFATGVNPEDEFKSMKITASATIGGLLTTGSGQVVVKAFKPRCAVVVFDPDTLAPGDTASLSFQAPEGEDGFPDDQRFDVHIFGNKGTLLAIDGKKGNDLSGLSGQMRYIAPDTSLTVQLFAKTSPPSGPPVIITSVAGPGEVALGTSANTNGENQFAALADVCVLSKVVVEKVDEIGLQVTLDPAETTPIGPTVNEGSFIAVVVEAIKKGEPVQGVTLKLEAEPVEGSGGHEHVGGRKAGSFIVSDGLTGSNGKYRTIYFASNFGGIEKILVSSPETSQKGSAELIVRVPGLVPLVAGEHLITMHTTPDAEQNHHLANANYGTQTTITAITKVIADYSEEVELSADVFLGAIDMSLLSGGLYDMKGDWSPPHDLHRRGWSIDFTKFYRNQGKTIKKVPIYVDGKALRTTNEVNEDRLDFWFDYYGFKRLEKDIGLIHYERR